MERKTNNKWIGKAAVVGLIVLGILAFRYFELGQYLSLDYIKSSQEKFQALYKRKFRKAPESAAVEKNSTHCPLKGEAHV